MRETAGTVMKDVRILPWLLLAGWAASVAGCMNDYGGRKEIKGSVTLKGVPLDDGVIDFQPVGDAVTKEGAMITQGAYIIQREHGLVPGKYRVSITAGDGRTRAGANPDEPPGPTGANIVSKDRVPPEYNVNSKQEVEVTAKGPNVFDFKIP
jgi:hypothetical protein